MAPQLRLLLGIAAALARGRGLTALVRLARLGEIVTDDCRRRGDIGGAADAALTACFEDAAETAQAAMERRRPGLPAELPLV